MIFARFERHATAHGVGHLGFAAASGEADARLRQHRQRGDIELVAGPGEAHRRRDPMLATPGRDDFELFRESADILRGNGEVVARVIADFKAVPMQLGDLLPRHVVALVGREREALGDEERGTETVLFQHRPSDRVVRRGRIVEGQHHQPIGDWRRGENVRRGDESAEEENAAE